MGNTIKVFNMVWWAYLFPDTTLENTKQCSLKWLTKSHGICYQSSLLLSESFPGLLEKLYNSWIHVTHTDGEVPQAVWQILLWVNFWISAFWVTISSESDFFILKFSYLNVDMSVSFHNICCIWKYYQQICSLRLTLNDKIQV